VRAVMDIRGCGAFAGPRDKKKKHEKKKKKKMAFQGGAVKARKRLKNMGGCLEKPGNSRRRPRESGQGEKKSWLRGGKPEG